MNELWPLLVAVAVAGAGAWWWRRGEGQVRSSDERFAELRTLGVPPGSRALVEFTAPGCGPCADARRVLDEVAGGVPGIAIVEVDVARHPDLARRHHVLRAPTVFVVAADGQTLGRVGGVPAADDLRALLGVSAPLTAR